MFSCVQAGHRATRQQLICQSVNIQLVVDEKVARYDSNKMINLFSLQGSSLI